MRALLNRLAALDRRFVFLGVLVLAVAPFFLKAGIRVESTRYTDLIWEQMEGLKSVDDPGFKPLLLSADYDPGTVAELGPMAKAVLRHVFEKDSGVIVLTFLPTGGALVQDVILEIAKEYEHKGVREGRNYAYLGFATPPGVIMQSIGREIRDNFQVDYAGKPIDKMPIFKNVHTYKDIHLVVDLAGSNMPGTWIGNAVARYDANFAMGVTAVMAADNTPYIPKQAKGMISGLRGAAEYEQLLQDKYGIELEDASWGMDSLSVTHLFILLLIVVGNLGYFLGREKRGGAR